MEETGDIRTAGLIADRKASGGWFLIPAVVAALGVLSIVLLLGTDRTAERLRNEAAIEDTIMDALNHTATFHLWLEEAIAGNVPVTINEALDTLDQAIKLVDVTLKGGEAENKLVLEPLADQELRAQAEEIKSLLIQLKGLGLERYQKSDRSGSGSVLEQEFHAVFKKSISELRVLEIIIERAEARIVAKSKSLFHSILGVWVFILIASVAGLWNLERQRKNAEKELRAANEQLLSQTEELTGYRESLEKLVEKRTSELSDANELLRDEITERRYTAEMLRRSESLLRELSSQIMTVEERERKRISWELHDDLGQELVFMKMQIRSLERRPGADADQENFETVLHGIDRIIDKVGHISRDLSPHVLDDLGLAAAIRNLADNFAESSNIHVTSEIADVNHLFSEDDQILLYRIVQEAFTNIGKHAGAKNVSLAVRRDGDTISFVLADNGKGFDMDKVSAGGRTGKGLGLMFMRERAQILGGTFALLTGEGKGTEITVTIPVERDGLA